MHFIDNDDDNKEATQIITIVIVILNTENLKMEDCLF